MRCEIIGRVQHTGGITLSAAPHVDAPVTKKSFVPRLDIQGLRAFAVLTVLAYHAGLPVPGGFIGVDVFFVISGFVITGALMREWESTGGLRVGRFALRRYWRLTPALAAVVLFTVLVSSLLQSPLGAQQATSATAIGALLLAANGVIAHISGGYFDGPAESNPLLHTWSLSVEEQFYLVFPILMLCGWLVARKLGWRRIGPIAVVVLISVPSFLLAMYGPNLHIFGEGNWLSGFYSPLTRAWEFGAGAILALAGAVVATRGRIVANIVGIAGAMMLISSLWLIDAETAFPGKWTVLPVAGTMLVILAGSSAQSVVSRAISSKIAVRIGDWSYSLYLWHWPFIVFAFAILDTHSMWVGAAACLLSILPAIASYRYVEQPLRRIPAIGWARLARRMVAVTAAPLVIALALGLGANASWGSDSIRNLQVAQTIVGATPGCFADQPATIKQPTDCIQNAEGAADPVYLLGDSNAVMFAPGVRAAALEADAPFASYTFSSCPVLGDELVGSITHTAIRPGCLDYQTRALSWLDTAAPGTVFLGASDYYLRTTEISVPTPTATVTNDTAVKIGWYANALGNVIDRLEAGGHRVVVINPIPNYWLEDVEATQANWKGPDTCANVALLLGACNSTMDTSLSDKRDRQQPVWDMIETESSAHGATVLDLTDDICAGNDCPIIRDGVPIFRDANHITPQVALALSDEFLSALTN